MGTPFSDWFTPNYVEYTPQLEGWDNKLTNRLKKYDITIYMGTWCGDSRREVPRILKLLDELGYDSAKYSIIALNQKNKRLTEGKRN